MNFLAHLQLVPDVPALQLGGVLADLVKGREVQKLPTDVQEGVRLHRAIDSYTDSHPRVATAIRRIAPRWGWFSGIILDIHFDHLLIRHWDQFHAEPLTDFVTRMNGRLADVEQLAPEAWPFISGLIRDNRLMAPGTIPGLTTVLARTSRRIAERMPTRALPLEEAVPELIALDSELVADFLDFYPNLTAHVASLVKPG